MLTIRVLSGLVTCLIVYEAQAACEWSFNWYCSGCAKIGARTTGTNGGFVDRQSCEAARANMQNTMDSRGGGVNTVPCQSAGACSPATQRNAPRSSGSTDSDSGYSAPTPSDYDAAADQRRREEARRREEQLRQEQEARAERERQERARRDREDALSRMKGGALGQAEALRGSSSWDAGLKGLPPSQSVAPAAASVAPGSVPSSQSKARSEKCGPNPDPSAVDLCDRNANVAIDPRAVRGKRVVNISLQTLANENYNKGFAAIRARDFEGAIAYFGKAGAELGDDPLVRNGRALAEDLLKAERQKTKLSAARRELHEGVMSTVGGRYDEALAHLARAVELDPANPRYKEELDFVRGVKAGESIGADRAKSDRQRELYRKAMDVGEKSLPAFYNRDWPVAIATLQAALQVYPDHPVIKDVLAIAEGGRDRDALAQQKKTARTTK